MVTNCFENGKFIQPRRRSLSRLFFFLVSFEFFGGGGEEGGGEFFVFIPNVLS
jgi:hypothetical protein